MFVKCPKLLVWGALCSIILMATACNRPSAIPPTNSPLPFTARSTVVVTVNPLAEGPVTVAPFSPGVTNTTAFTGSVLLSLEQPLQQGDISSPGSGIYQIFRLDARSGTLARLTDTSTDETEASMSPDGRKIVFVSGRDHPSNRDLYVMNVDGTDQKVFFTSQDKGTNLSPQWSPDGTRVAWYSSQDGHFEIYVANADGSSVQRLTNSARDSAAPSWSPDGKEIVFASDANGYWDINLMNADGSNQHSIGGVKDNFNWRPHFSPSGQVLIFSSMDQQTHIYTMNKDGSNLRQITNAEGDQIQANWVDDSQFIYVAREKGGNVNPLLKWQLYLYDFKGNKETLIYAGSGNIRDPFFMPGRASK